MIKKIRLPARSEVAEADTWDLTKLFSSDEQWEKDLRRLKKMAGRYASFAGTLHESPEKLVACLKFDLSVDRLSQRLGCYAYLRLSEDQTNDHYQQISGRFQSVATRVGEAASFIRPEILSIPAKKMASMLAHSLVAPYRLLLERLLRYKPYTLTAGEEKLLSMQGEMASVASRVFRQLHDADLRFGSVVDETGRKVELTPATLQQLLRSPQRSVRKTAFHQFYAQFESHRHTLAAALSGSVQKDVYYARARGFDSCLDSALFADNVPRSVYDQLIATVRRYLPVVHKYYELRRKSMRLRSINHYDTYVPILSQLRVKHSWGQAVDVIIDSLAPLGEGYTQVLRQGLSGRWCDRYPNQGKQSGAFSYGVYDGEPYILMNYKPTVLTDVFTLTHEAGHSMHSYLSCKHQPFEYHDYSIFVAEVASTFNEQLLNRHLIAIAKDDHHRAYLINNEIDDIRATIVRQTMFAEFEKITHEMVEAGQPLTSDVLRGVYRQLLEAYFGPDFTIDNELSLECLRIPHFYRPFYVYKYATGLAAAIDLAGKVIRGGDAEREAYLSFLKGGCSKYPLDLLRDAGVDLEQPYAVETAMQTFAQRVDQLAELLK